MVENKPIWINLNTTVVKVCKNGQLDGFRTNHSLRSAASRLHSREIDEQIIQELIVHENIAVCK